MNKKVKWGLTAVIGCGLIAWGIYSQLPKLNTELEQAEKAACGKMDRPVHRLSDK